MANRRYTSERRAVAQLVETARDGRRLNEIILGAELIAAGRALLSKGDIGIARAIVYAELDEALRCEQLRRAVEHGLSA